MSNLDRVIFEYSNGEKKELYGVDLEKWLKFNSLVASCAEIHGMNPPWDEVKWRTMGKDIPY